MPGLWVSVYPPKPNGRKPPVGIPIASNASCFPGAKSFQTAIAAIISITLGTQLRCITTRQAKAPTVVKICSATCGSGQHPGLQATPVFRATPIVAIPRLILIKSIGCCGEAVGQLAPGRCDRHSAIGIIPMCARSSPDFAALKIKHEVTNHEFNPVRSRIL